ncbi:MULTISPECIES: hypothetical protein [unclassified Sphingobium]|uniref:hypothetical protein n=1 Tax=unclassified Sphingobium TaxID=2611147 RepID=UPI0035A73DA4
MFKRTTFIVGIFLLAAFALKARDESRFITLPDGATSIRVGSIFSTDVGHWTVTVKNKYGRSSDKMFAIGDNPRSNIYLTSSRQLVVIGKGGEELFFRVPSKAGPTALNGQQAQLRDKHSETWHYVGVIENRALRHNAECIPLMGESRSPYRKQFQSEHSC